MTVRRRIALTIFVTGIVTALGVMATVALAFQRFEHERSYDRANAFLGRVVARYDDIVDIHARQPEAFKDWLGSLLLFEPDTQLYLLAADGTVLASTGRELREPGYKVSLAPVQQAVAAVAGLRRAPYVMGDDPEHMNADAVITARALHRASIQPGTALAGYLYLVAQRPALPAGRLEMFRSSLAGPALAGVAAVIVLTTALAVWIIATVTRPLRVLSEEVAAAQRDGFDAATVGAAPLDLVMTSRDEFAQLRAGFRGMLAKLRSQWDTLRQLDRFRRESVSNLSHDLRSPLTATVACLETLDRRWAHDPARSEDRELAAVALRNARNAAQLVRSLGDLALLDEAEFKLNVMVVDLVELLDDICLRFADRAAQQGVTLRNLSRPGAAVFAAVDIELFERALANLVDNALKFTASAGHITLQAQAREDHVEVRVADSGAGIAAPELGRLFDRLYTTGLGGKGLGLAIVKRIVELHQGEVAVASEIGRGTNVTVRLPAR